MQPYDDILTDILNNGETQINKRTGAECKVIVGTQQKYDLRQGFPAITTRKLPFRNIVGELLGFFKGYTNAKDFRDIGCYFWTQNANETSSWLANPLRKGEDDLGPIYGKQWTSWSDKRVVADDQIDLYISKGYSYRGHIDDKLKQKSLHIEDYTHKGLVLMERSINQLENAVRAIMTDPSDRRIIVTGLNIGEFDMMSLPPCHLTYKFVPMPDSKVMHLVMDMRSMDFYLGTPSNIAGTALLLAIMCRLTGYTPGIVTIQGTNTHLYSNSYEAAREILKRKSYLPPQLYLSSRIARIHEVENIPGCFEKINPGDIEIVNYNSHPNINVSMIA